MVSESSPPPHDALWLALDPECKLLITRDLTVRYANSAAHKLVADGRLRIGHDNRLRLGTAEATETLAELVMTAAKQQRWRRRLVTALGENRWLTASVTPASLSPTHSLLLTLHDIRLDGDIDPGPAADAFHLSASEVPILKGLLRADSPKQIAIDLGISVHTVRSHIRSIFARMNVHSTAEVIKAALNIAMFNQDHH